MKLPLSQCNHFFNQIALKLIFYLLNSKFVHLFFLLQDLILQKSMLFSILNLHGAYILKFRTSFLFLFQKNYLHRQQCWFDWFIKNKMKIVIVFLFKKMIWFIPLIIYFFITSTNVAAAFCLFFLVCFCLCMLASKKA